MEIAKREGAITRGPKIKGLKMNPKLDLGCLKEEDEEERLFFEEQDEKKIAEKEERLNWFN